MSDKDSLKNQRDRFLAFSFASSDLFLEIGPDGLIHYTTGAIKGLLGGDDKIEGLRWLDLFDEMERPLLKSMAEKARPGMRFGPLLVKFEPKYASGNNKKGLITGIRMPENQNLYITIGVSNMMMAKLADGVRDAQQGALLDKESFTETAIETFDMARSLDQDIDITLLDLDASDENINRFGKDDWDNFMDEITSFLKSRSLDGQAAAEIAKGRYSVIHDKSVNPESLTEQISNLAQELDPTGEGLEVNQKTITSDLATMSDKDTSRAIIYTIGEFERRGTDLTIENLNSGFKAYLSANAQKIKDFQSMVERLSFDIYFQPIVRLDNFELSHYEMLARFDEGDTLEWVMFGEDIGMAAEFDIAVCERAIHYVAFKAGGTSTRYTVNISGQSIENEAFFEKLTKQLSSHGGNLQNRLMFEITESSQMSNLDAVAQFVTELQEKGFQVALDDFGSGAASFQYLQKLNVDYVKIDGKYIRKLLSSQRDAAMVKNLAQMCRDLDIKVIAEFVEEEPQLTLLRNMGIEYGQGYLLGRPAPKPSYEKPASLPTGKLAKTG